MYVCELQTKQEVNALRPVRLRHEYTELFFILFKSLCVCARHCFAPLPTQATSTTLTPSMKKYVRTAVATV